VLPPWTCVITGIHQRWYNGSSSSVARYDIIQRPRISKTVAPQSPLVNRPKCAKTLQNDRRPFKCPHLHAPYAMVHCYSFESCKIMHYTRTQTMRGVLQCIFYKLLLLVYIGRWCSYMRRVVCFQILYYNINYTYNKLI